MSLHFFGSNLDIIAKSAIFLRFDPIGNKYIHRYFGIGAFKPQRRNMQRSYAPLKKNCLLHNLNASTETVVSYFSTHSAVVLLSAFLQVGAAIPFAIFAACMLSRFLFFGATAAGPWIAFTGGAIAAIDELLSGAAIAVMAQPLVAQNGPLVQAFHYFSVALGGPGFTMPFGLLMAGISIAGGVMKIVPKWLVAFGLVLAVVGELSWLSMVFPRMGLLIPLARWPGFIWLIAVGFAVPNRLSVRDGA